MITTLSTPPAGHIVGDKRVIVNILTHVFGVPVHLLNDILASIQGVTNTHVDSMIRKDQVPLNSAAAMKWLANSSRPFDYLSCYEACLFYRISPCTITGMVATGAISLPAKILVAASRMQHAMERVLNEDLIDAIAQKVDFDHRQQRKATLALLQIPRDGLIQHFDAVWHQAGEDCAYNKDLYSFKTDGNG